VLAAATVAVMVVPETERVSVGRPGTSSPGMVMERLAALDVPSAFDAVAVTV